VDTYLSKVDEASSDENLDLARAKAEQSILTNCDAARQNRLALLLLVVSASTLLATASLTLRRGQAPDRLPAAHFIG
jgi:hypothetical protein